MTAAWTPRRDGETLGAWMERHATPIYSTPIVRSPRWLTRLAGWWRGLRSDRGAHRRTRRDDWTGTAYGAPWAPAERPATVAPSMLPGEDSWLHLQLVRLYLWVDLMQLEQEHWSAA